jgi:hypothetical protein
MAMMEIADVWVGVLQWEVNVRVTVWLADRLLTVFSLWDRWRGTLVQTDLSCGALLGVPGEVDTYPQGFLAQFVEPLRRIGRWGRVPLASTVRG